MFAATARARCSGRFALLRLWALPLPPTRTIETASLKQSNSPLGGFRVTGVWDRGSESYVLTNDRARRSGHM